MQASIGHGRILAEVAVALALVAVAVAVRERTDLHGDIAFAVARSFI